MKFNTLSKKKKDSLAEEMQVMTVRMDTSALEER